MRLEISAASVEDCVIAAEGGADRVELNSALQLGGLTPSLGALREALRSIRLPIIAMVRPRPGGFAYSALEFRTMLVDAELLLAHGAHGLAFGVLHEDGRIDRDRTRILVEQSGKRERVFHRAFDLTPDPLTALEELIDLGITRVMTSGQEATAYNGTATIARLAERAAGRIEILPAGGINRFTIADVLARTGCDQVHASLSRQQTDRSGAARPQVSFNAPRLDEHRYTMTDAAAVADLRDRLTRWEAEYHHAQC